MVFLFVEYLGGGEKQEQVWQMVQGTCRNLRCVRRGLLIGYRERGIQKIGSLERMVGSSLGIFCFVFVLFVMAPLNGYGGV